ncbi:helix-turn-helix domain-containing protein [Streptomyces europaeiscabiei]|uniref:helix-turn-helix domain-containing protein n=1 Tax=Streptomyces europaeiscabiei TaxID=146819 RepID=UPI000765F3EA|nr:helix-turn-helix transcriptional regulator [Streptomyces europaeiscabiei]MDX3671965.1 helix-turn-helix transcriptional regulator [Streptomyces europaeiscabiei]MDX3715899.1 helix-turn-helix transcriptional regulator [Streptomyces europaeiscabiei]MDX3866243.1 helix-turn-helix transcriptional regulator [Streptomyces europaeiscabiei]
MTATGDPGPLATYLRARRELVLPAAAGIPDTGNRRVAGLRREEVAFLAGVSSDYYVRLEQGRDRHPSEQVLVSIAGALQLDEEATAYLLQLAASPSTRRRRPRPEKAGDGIRTLINTWPLTPAYVHGTYMDVLAANALAIALSTFNAPGHNSILAAFLEPELRALHADWDEMTARIVPYLRSVAGPDIDDPRLVEIVGELSVRGDRFRKLWARQDVKHKATGTSRLLHPQVGTLDLHYEKLLIPGTRGQTLVTYHARPGSDAEDRLRLLASLDGSTRTPADTVPTTADG